MICGDVQNHGFVVMVKIILCIDGQYHHMHVFVVMGKIILCTNGQYYHMLCMFLW